MGLTNLERAVLRGALAVAEYLQSIDKKNEGVSSSPQVKSGPTPTSNEKPMCAIHGTEMQLSDYKPKFGSRQYYCTRKDELGNRCKEKVYEK